MVVCNETRSRRTDLYGGNATIEIGLARMSVENVDGIVEQSFHQVSNRFELLLLKIKLNDLDAERL